MTPERGGLLGVVLAGGRSRRYGSDKADARIAGRTMLARALDALAPHVERRGLILGAVEEHDPSELPAVPVRRDRAIDLGPLEGLRVALEWAEEDAMAGAFALACDLPLVDATVVGALVERWRERAGPSVDALVPRVDGVPQPLAAVYSVSALAAVESRLSGRDRSLLGALGELRVRYVEAADGPFAPGRFLNVNTPADGEAAGSLLDAEPGRGGVA